MSTRCNVILKDNDGDKVIFYRHWDGYPEGVKPTLDKFIEWVKEGKIRNNVVQSSGWIVALGMFEYQHAQFKTFKKLFGASMRSEENISGIDFEEDDIEEIHPPSDLKIGSYEITTDLHGDIAHVYLIDLSIPEWKEIDITQAEKVLDNAYPKE